MNSYLQISTLESLRVSGNNHEVKDREEWIQHLADLKGKLTELSFNLAAGFTPDQISKLPKVKVWAN